MASQSVGLGLYDAARAMGVPFTNENQPTNRSVRANGMEFNYLEWGSPGNPKILMLHGVSQQERTMQRAANQPVRARVRYLHW